MMILGLTGGIACGKSNVSATLEKLGARIIDGDVLSRALTCPGGEALPAIRAAFGEALVDENGVLDRRMLGAIVFGSAEKRAQLDAIMQPMLRRRIDQAISQAREDGCACAVLDMPLLYEAQLDPLCDRVWCVWIPREEQLNRLMLRDGFTREQAEARLNAQLPADEKAARADVVIDTSGTIEETCAMIPGLYARELRRSK